MIQVSSKSEVEEEVAEIINMHYYNLHCRAFKDGSGMIGAGKEPSPSRSAFCRMLSSGQTDCLMVKGEVDSLMRILTQPTGITQDIGGESVSSGLLRPPK